MNELGKTNDLGSFLQTIPTDFSNKPAVQYVELDEDELNAGGQSATGLNMSKEVAQYRMVLPSGKNAQYEIIDQNNEECVMKLDSVKAILLLGHHVYKLKKYHVENPKKDYQALTDEDKQVLAASFDVRATYDKSGKRLSGSNGNFEVAGFGKYLSNPQLFRDITNGFSRIHIYALFPFIPQFNGKIIFITLTVIGAGQYDKLLKGLARRTISSLPYNIVELSHTAALSKTKVDYRKPVMEFVKNEENFKPEDVPMLREKILPQVKRLRELHEIVVMQSEQGNVSDYGEEKEISGTPISADEIEF